MAVQTNVSYYIPSIDAKDIYLASHYLDKESTGYSLRLKNGEINLRKFINTLDYSLDSIELLKIYRRKYRNNGFYFKANGHYYSYQVINLTFKYSVKDWNQMNKNTYVKFGYDYRDLVFEDNIALNSEGQIVGIVLNTDVASPVAQKLLESTKYFEVAQVDIYDKKDTSKVLKTETHYCKVREFKTIKTNSELRKELYENGFICEDIRYCRMKRSSGSARVGKCLFVNRVLYKPLLNFSSGGIRLKKAQEIDLAAYESYISLPSSSIIDTLEIKPENILVIDDYDSVFNEDVVATRNINGWLSTQKENCEISNSIWDGQSLMDISLFGKYSKYGMVLLRNLMFKSCCFNTNIQKWFEDNNITDVSQLNGKTRATDIKDIKLITTPNSIKYLKFSSLDEWLDNLYPEFGVVKHDKKTHFFGGRLVQTHYQLINTLQLSKKDMEEFLKESLDFAQMLKNQPEVVRYFIKYPDIEEIQPFKNGISTTNDAVFNLLSINDKFSETKYYNEFVNSLMKAYYKNLKNGHVYVNGNYSTLFGNPLEMLQATIGTFKGESVLGVGNIHSKRFEYDKELLGSRSPHVTMGNIWVAKNVANEDIDKYFNLTNEIVCINAIGENVLQRLSGAD